MISLHPDFRTYSITSQSGSIQLKNKVIFSRCFFEDMAHPDDLEKLMKMQIDHSHFIYSLDTQNRNDYSNIYKFRMRNLQKKYLNVMSRQQVIQQDANGKAWIILGEINISQYHQQDDNCSQYQGLSAHSVPIASFAVIIQVVPSFSFVGAKIQKRYKMTINGYLLLPLPQVTLLPISL